MKKKFENDAQLREMAEALANVWMSKQQIRDMFKLSSSRTARLKVALIAEEMPVLSMSTKRGYKVCTDTDLTDDIKRADAELRLKIEALQRRRKPLQRELKRRAQHGID